jgi:hypothetical protein
MQRARRAPSRNGVRLAVRQYASTKGRSPCSSMRFHDIMRMVPFFIQIRYTVL